LITANRPERRRGTNRYAAKAYPNGANLASSRDLVRKIAFSGQKRSPDSTFRPKIAIIHKGLR
jgi:hypothetical protein